eukprot:5291157-Amphidinium_carterae.1
MFSVACATAATHPGSCNVREVGREHRNYHSGLSTHQKHTTWLATSHLPPRNTATSRDQTPKLSTIGKGIRDAMQTNEPPI